jgi:myo-inositol-1(or 4)-monophosphatase
VAAGMMKVARFATPNVWDVAGGVVLVQAAGGKVRMAVDGQWVPLHGFHPPTRPGAKTDLREWRSEIVLGDSKAVAMLCDARPPRGARKGKSP